MEDVAKMLGENEDIKTNCYINREGKLEKSARECIG